jgi:hypothetical protein
MSREQLLSRVRDLTTEKPVTKMGQVRWAWPEIEAALEAGHSLQTIHARLNEVGIEIGYRTLSLYIGRLKRKHEPSQNNRLTAAKDIGKRAPDDWTAGALQSRPNESNRLDPYSNLRLDRERKKRAAFEYDAFSTNKNLMA